MRISEKGINFLKQLEGEKLEAYQDDAGVWTIGVGHTGIDVYKGKKITSEESSELLKKDINRFESQVNKSIKVTLNQNQFDVCVCLAFNIGAFSTSSVARFINEGKPQSEIDRAFRMWNKITDPKTKKKVVNKGLINRREKEIKFFKGEY